ncbi:MAG: ABC transporter substrate-binding protein [Christensenellales bacterium]
MSALPISMAEDVSNVVFISNNLGYEELLQEYIDTWNASNPDLQVELYTGSGTTEEYWTQLSAAFAAGNGYDIYMMSPSYFQQYIDNGMCLELNDWFEDSEGWYDYAINDVTRNGNIYGYPAFNDLMALYVNTDLLEKYGYSLPDVTYTWDEFIEICSTIAEGEGLYGFMQSIIFEGYGQFEWYPELWCAGGDILTGDEVLTNKEGVKKALGFWRDIINSPGGCPDMGQSVDYFINKMCFSFVGGQWNLNNLNDAEEEGVLDINWTVLPYPTETKEDTPYTVMGGWKYCVYKDGKNPGRCADFLKWLLDESDFQGVAAEHFLKWAPKQSVVESLDFYDEGGMKLFKDNIINKANKGMEPAYGSLELAAIGDALEAALFDASASLDDIVDKLEADLNELR